MHRELLGTYALVVGGALLGLIFGVFVFESDRPIVAGLLFVGGGTMIGAFIAAIVANEPLAGHGGISSPAPPWDLNDLPEGGEDDAPQDRGASRAL